VHPTFAFNAELGFDSIWGDFMHFEMKGERLSKHSRLSFAYVKESCKASLGKQESFTQLKIP